MTPACQILVIDDDHDLRESLVDALIDNGHEVTAAENGDHALRILRATETLPRLILLDLMMPVMDGIEFRARQRADARLRDIPVVVLSADAAVQERAREMGVSGHSRKPVNLTQLYALVERCCGAR
ncbi:MAG: response regulator [Myxococcales bacterium]|nr:response regulator [Myxococcales bacterium]